MEWRAGLLEQKPIMKPANFLNECTVALDMLKIIEANIKWRQFEEWAISTPSQHIIVESIRWIR
eukprot:3011659-Karenia_brevis.AAC.1